MFITTEISHGFSHLSEPNSMLLPKIRLKITLHILSDPLLAVVVILDVA